MMFIFKYFHKKSNFCICKTIKFFIFYRNIILFKSYTFKFSICLFCIINNIKLCLIYFFNSYNNFI